MTKAQYNNKIEQLKLSSQKTILQNMWIKLDENGEKGEKS